MAVRSFIIFPLMFIHADGRFALCVSQFTQFRTPISHRFFRKLPFRSFAFRISQITHSPPCEVILSVANQLPSSIVARLQLQATGV